MSDGVNYKDISIVKKLKKIVTDEGEVISLDLNFKPYSMQVLINGVDRTYNYQNDLSLDGVEALINTSCICSHKYIPSEEAKAFSRTDIVSKESPSYKFHEPRETLEEIIEDIVC